MIRVCGQPMGATRLFIVWVIRKCFSFSEFVPWSYGGEGFVRRWNE